MPSPAFSRNPGTPSPGMPSPLDRRGEQRHNPVQLSPSRTEARDVMSTDLNQPILERPATRADLARQLLARVDRLAPRLGTIPLAAELQLLKRELARGHAVLSRRPEDNNF